MGKRRGIIQFFSLESIKKKLYIKKNLIVPFQLIVKVKISEAKIKLTIKENSNFNEQKIENSKVIHT